jgi:indole-3-glycerol phosphate synthase
LSVLDRIVARVRERLADRIRALPEQGIRAAAEAAPARKAFRPALAEPGTTLIAEAKHASPSRGVLREPYDPAGLARDYAAAGARAISVLTEPDFFRGAPDHLEAVREVVDLPLLRKDFLVDPYQAWEAKAWGASAALLIVAALDDARLRDLRVLLEELGVCPLVEVHTEAEAERALAAGADVLGVNNRDLATFETDRTVTGRVVRGLPSGTLVVSESGIFTRQHVLEVEAAGASAVLVGEALLASADPRRKVAELMGAAGGAA